MTLEAPGSTIATSSEPTSVSTTPSTRALVRRARGPLAVAAVFVLLAALAAVTSDTGVGLLDTRSPSKAGSKAVAELLRDRDVGVRQIRTVAETREVVGGTLVVAGADALTVKAARTIAATSAARVVLLGATRTEVVQQFVPGVEVLRATDPGVRQPACAYPAAALAGSADAGGAVFRAAPRSELNGATASVVGCYPVGGDPSMLAVSTARRTVVLMGASDFALNDRLAREGNAALALNLIGTDGAVTWYLPSLEDLYADDGTAASPFDLAPRGVLWTVGWLALLAVLLAAWRARRLGPVVAENLPVVVRASETVEGRARLYRRGRNRDRAADLLRTAARDRMTPALGLPVNPPRESVVAAVARRTARPPADVAALLYGAAPTDDAALVRLADALDRLDREVRRT